MIALIWILVLFCALIILSYHRASLAVSTIGLTVLLLILSVLTHLSLTVLSIVWSIWILLAFILNLGPLRIWLISQPIMRAYAKRMPKFSLTEQAVLHAGNVGWEAELMSGMPDWNKLQQLPWAKMSPQEQEFLNGPVEQLCALINPWLISRSMEVPEEIWQRIKQDGYFGLVIPAEYGGKGFSAYGHAQVIMKLASVSTAVATIVAVPNSLGPAELLLRYGTYQQKSYYLPRLATGEEIPCFALTSPVAGSDASAITDFGIIGRYFIEGKEQLGINLHWDKRYITLSPVTTLIGLAFKLFDPEHLLGDQEELGITCALISASTPGVEIGQRHYPLDCAFPNGPTKGDQVKVTIDAVIGGTAQIGKGWPMLMETLAAGRSISIPSIATAAAKRAAVGSGAYARIRRQFNTFIGDFDGIQRSLAKIGGYAYIAEALRIFSIAQVDHGIKSGTAAAISKLHTTELSRRVIKHAMDVHGGKAICMGPHNYLAQLHIEAPIAITVEGANILTRSLIIFGQGSLRCHPFLLKELEAVRKKDSTSFDENLFAHVGYFFSNKVRALVMGLVNKSDIYYQLSRLSAALALTTDVLIITLGSSLKRQERLSLRLGDLLSFLYMISALLKYQQVNQLRESAEQEAVVVKWCCQELLSCFQHQFDELLLNLPNRLTAGLLRFLVMPWGRCLRPSSDLLTSEVAKSLMVPGALRERLAHGAYFGTNDSDPLYNLEQRLSQIIAVEPLLVKLQHALRDHLIKGKNINELIKAAQAQSILTAAEAEQLLATEATRMEMIMVDKF